MIDSVIKNDSAPEKKNRIAATGQSDMHAVILQTILEYAKFPHGQGFAIVLNGAWGSGKTKFIKKHINLFSRERPGEVEQKALYVSLYGVNDISQIEDRLFEQLHPILSHKATRLAGAVLRGAAKAAIKIDISQGWSVSGSAGEVDFSSLLKNAEGRVVIFDDLERASMSPVAILGYLNPLVEHEDCKVIILADESQIDTTKKDEYQLKKEKTIGRTIDFLPDVNTVYGFFLDEIDDVSAKRFLEEYRGEVIKIFLDSKYDNLRLLKYFMWDFEKIWKKIDASKRDNFIAMKEILQLLTASAIELRHGLSLENFHLVTHSNLIAWKMGGNKNGDRRPMEILQDKYPSVRFDSVLLDTDTIIDLVVRSKVDADKLNNQLERHPYFAKADGKKTISWQALWSSYELPASDQDAVVDRFEADFQARAFSDREAIYHIFGLCLWLSDIGYPNWRYENIEKALMHYVDDIYAARTPNDDEIARDEPIDTRIGAYGLGYRKSKDPIFHAMIKYEQEVHRKWRRSGYPRIASRLLELAGKDGEMFLRQVCHTAGGPATFARVGIMTFIPPWELARMISKSIFREQSKVLIALSSRYEHIYDEEVSEEMPWVRMLGKMLDAEAQNLPRIARDSLVELNRHYLYKIGNR